MKKQTVALLPGSYDPVTLGHLDIIRRASALFDTVYVTAFLNPKKHYLFSEEARLHFLQEACKPFPNVICAFDRGMVVDFIQAHRVNCIIKGIRDAKDLAYEQEMAAYNRAHSGADTFYLDAEPTLAHCSSSALRQALKEGASLSPYLPEHLIPPVLAAWKSMQ